MYLVGLLFGLGFDTATEVACSCLTGAGAAPGLPWYAILCLPVLFAAGMSLFDTIDGSFMTVAYGWALARPVRKVYYNLVITGLSVAVALVIGTVEMLALPANGCSLHGGSGRGSRRSISTRSASSSSGSSCRMGRRARGLAPRAPRGTVGAAGLVARARLVRAAHARAGHNGALCSASSTSTAPSCSRPPRRTRRPSSRRWAPSMA